MLSVGDVNLLAAQQIVTLLARHRAGSHCREIRPCLRLGEIHGPGPFSGHHRRKILGFLFVTALQENCLRCGLGKHRAESKGHIGSIPHLLNGTGESLGQALSAVLRIKHQTRPACLTELGIRLPPGFRCRDHPRINRRPALIT